ncbi:DUF1109 domain-containing protein [Myxococcus llanfairpwllgwyngyllgogerychwyrndrobwllllantysiliogogogochensis]|uniref:DUF1109 domain-containing protein n=1 Tax=Myxococcus llanfairpwllgwyngyllgogerychwyrndrobwllllantysiliogogogochensis TaxID=2590453 RepID=A0A540WUR0_9BACT|nr:DUF1109 family protein [Myxococcus llanfairpwllgwyngyllgogerychwyrndrobwllllantysiliogogogochensis]TQF12174.1 DUF1109 domain-containing protein [Myxococcus llanfairpwllgwyngyllgogerychwyrndrobwllllantysiliogogogochensis]
MTPECSRVMDCLGEALPPELTKHVASCEDCQVVTGGFDLLGGPSHATASTLPTASASSEDDEQTLPGHDTARRFALETLAKQPMARPWWHGLALLVGVHAAMVGVGLTLLSRRGGWVGNASPPGLVVGVGVVILALLGAGAFVALSPRRRVVPWAGVLAFAGALGVTVVLTGSGQQGRALLAGVLGCAGTELAVTVVPLAVTLALLSRSAYHPARALAAGLSAGSVSLLVLHVHCPDGTAAHLLWGHVVPWLGLAGIAVLLRSLLPTRSYAP